MELFARSFHIHTAHIETTCITANQREVNRINLEIYFVRICLKYFHLFYFMNSRWNGMQTKTAPNENVSSDSNDSANYLRLNTIQSPK